MSIFYKTLDTTLCLFNYRDAFALCLLNSVTSFVSGFAIFSVLGFMSYELGVDIATVAQSGETLHAMAHITGMGFSVVGFFPPV